MKTETTALEDLAIDLEASYRLALILESFDDAVISTSLDGTVEVWNQGAIKLFGYSRSEAIGQPISLLVAPPEGAAAIAQKLAFVLQDKRTVRIDTVGLHKDGSALEVSAVAFPIKNSSGEIVGMSLILRDISEKKQIERAEETYEKFRYVFEHSPIGNSITALSGELHVNHAFCEMLGYAEEELKSSKWQDITHPDDIEPIQRLLEPMVAGIQESIRFAKRYLHKNGSVVWADVSASLRRDNSGNPLYFMTSIMDITERKRAEEELLKSHENLEKLVEERTAKLQEANKELESFAYSVSHDLRAPLRAIDGFSQQLLKRYADKLGEEGKRYLHIVYDNTKKMAQLIDDILAFSRMGRLEISTAEVDMEALAREVFDGLNSGVAERQIDIAFSNSLAPCRGDYAMLRQVWVNLLSNAIKFTRPRASAKIEIGGYAEAGENIYYIKDNGVGFDMRYADKLFGVFQRLHGVEEFEGTGIGLAIVSRIIAKHGGRTWAEGKVDNGTTIYFTLPC